MKLTTCKRALVVDDEPLWLNNLINLLSQAGYDVDAASSFSEAAKLLESNVEYGLVLTDIWLKGFDERQATGFDLLPKIKTDFKTTLKIIITSYHTEQSFLKAKEIGAEYIIKNKNFNTNLKEVLNNFASSPSIENSHILINNGQHKQTPNPFSSLHILLNPSI